MDEPGTPRAPGNLRAGLGGFFGRTVECATVAEELGRERLIALTGVGGVGKSRLAAHLGMILQDRFADGVWWVDLSAVRSPDVVDHAVAAALGLADNTDRPMRGTVGAHLSDRQALLVLDGYEQVVDTCAELTAELLRQAPRLRVLAAGRRPLDLPGERNIAVHPLADADAEALFHHRASCAVPDYTARREDREAVAEICRRLDNLPLALELAAGRLRALSVRQLTERLEDRFRMLTGGGTAAPPRHRTMRLAIGWSHELCAPHERLLWARLSVFAGDFDLEAAEYVCSGAGLPARDVLDVLEELVAQSVVVCEEGPAGLRYRMLQTVRAYGASWLELTGDARRMRRRHRDWYVGLATSCELDWFSPRQAEAAARVDVELPNLRVALEHCLEEPHEAHLGQYLAGTLWFYWVGCGRLAEGRHWLGRVLRMRGSHDDARLKALWVVGHVAVVQGDMAGAIGALAECREGARRTGNELAAAYGLHRTGCLALVTDDMARAERLLREALELYRRIGELNSNVLLGQVELALALVFQDDLAGAEALCEDVRQVCEDHGERWTSAYALFVLAFVAWARGEARHAHALLVESLAIDHAFHDVLGAALAVEMLALVTLDTGVGGGALREAPATGAGPDADGPGTGGVAAAEEAAALQGVAESLWPSVGLPLFGSRYFNRPHQLCRERASRELGARRYEECRASGRGWGLDTVVARMRGGPSLPGRREPSEVTPPAAGQTTPEASERP